MADKIVVSVEVVNNAANRALADLAKSGEKAEQQLNKLKGSGEQAFANIAVGITKTLGIYDIFVGNLLSNLAVKAFELISNSVAHLINEASVSEQAVRNLNVALSSAGLFSQKTSKDFQDFASSIQDVTVYSDEAVLASSTLLLNLTDLDEKGIKQATQAAVDLAATLNIDLTTATEMVAKAINGNVVALKKQGIEVQSAETGAGRLVNVLKALESQHGKAAAQAQTYAGVTAQEKNQQSELFEALGKVYTESDEVISKHRALADIYASAAKFVQNNTDALRDFGTALKITTEIALAGGAAYVITSATLGILGVAAYTGATAFGVLGLAASAAWAAITGPVGLVVIAVAGTVAVVYELIRHWDQVRIAVLNSTAAVLEFAAKATFGKLNDSLLKQAQSYRDQAAAIKSASDAAKAKAQQDAENSRADDEQAKIRKQRILDAEKDAIRHNAFLVTQKQLNSKDLVLLEADQQQKIKDLEDTYADEKALNERSFNALRYEDFLENQRKRLEAQQEFDKQELELNLAKQKAKAASENDDRKRREALDEFEQKAAIDRLNLKNKQELDLEKLKVDGLKKLDQLRLQNQKDSLTTIATLSNSNNRTLAGIGKAAGLVQIAIDTPVAISKALAAFPPPFNFAAAAAVGVAMAAQAAQLTGLQFADGGIVPGSSFSGDKVSAQVNSGEMILNKQQQAELFRVANGGGTAVGEKINQLAQAVMRLAAQPLVVNVDGKELFNITRNQLAGGRAF